MAFLKWSKAYSVGVPAMDEQHRRLMDLINLLHDAMKEGQGFTVVGDVLTELVDYTQTHFADEERLMREHGFESLAEHKAKHDALARQVLEIQGSLEGSTSAPNLSVPCFFRGWLLTHIRGVDRLYESWLNGARLAA